MPLSEVVQRLAARDGVEGVLLLSGDGLPIEHAAGARVDPETLAALAATAARHTGLLGEGVGFGEFATGVLEFGRGILILARAGADDWLAVLAGTDADIGPLLYDLRQHRAALATLL